MTEAFTSESDDTRAHETRSVRCRLRVDFSWSNRFLLLLILCLTVAGFPADAAVQGLTFLGTWPGMAGEGPAGVFGDQGYVYIAGRAGLTIVDVTEQRQPTRVTTFKTDAKGLDLFVKDKRVFLATAKGLRVVDVSDSLNPVLVGAWNHEEVGGVSVAGNVAYVATGLGGMYALNITNVAKPVVVGGYDTPRLAKSVMVLQDRLYVTDTFGGLFIFGLQIPEKPVFLGTYDTPGYAGDIAVQNGTAFIADGSTGVSIVAVTNPASPVALSCYYAGGFYSKVVASGEIAVLANAPTGMHVVDVSDPTQPREIGVYQLNGQILDAHIVDQTVYAVDGDGGFSIFLLNSTEPTPPMQLLNPLWNKTNGFAFFLTVTNGFYGIQVQRNGVGAWAGIGNYAIQSPGIIRIVDPQSVKSTSGFYRVIKK